MIGLIDKEREWLVFDYYHLSVLCFLSVSGLYGIIIFGKMFSLPGGWYYCFSQCIDNAQIIYKDFDYRISPIYLIALLKNDYNEFESLSLNSDYSISLFVRNLDISFQEKPFRNGNAIEKDPFLIEDKEKSKTFYNQVNCGRTCEGQYFKRNSNFDLENEDDCIPIGVSGKDHYFFGNYDGNGNSITGLKDVSGIFDNIGKNLFGDLIGNVENLFSSG